MITLRLYKFGGFTDRSFNSLDRAASIARDYQGEAEIRKGGKLIGIKPVGKDRINWIDKQ
jgi:hypothetical protein